MHRARRRRHVLPPFARCWVTLLAVLAWVAPASAGECVIEAPSAEALAGAGAALFGVITEVTADGGYWLQVEGVWKGAVGQRLRVRQAPDQYGIPAAQVGERWAFFGVLNTDDALLTGLCDPHLRLSSSGEPLSEEAARSLAAVGPYAAPDLPPHATPPTDPPPDPPPKRKLKGGECWSHEDCRRAGGGALMCSLNHVGMQPRPMPDTCRRDSDCRDPGERCVQGPANRHCSPPGHCEACCKP